MNELLTALTRAANAIASYYEARIDPTTPFRAGPTQAAPTEPEPKKEDTVKETKSRRTKKDAPTAEDKAAAGPTEEETAKGTTDVAKLLVAKFNKVVEGKPEGFHIAKKLLIEGFKVGRLSDLSHEQRIDFIAQVKAILTNGAPTEKKETAGVGL